MLTTIVAITLFALFCLIHLCFYLGSLSISQWLVGSPCAHLDTKAIKKKKKKKSQYADLNHYEQTEQKSIFDVVFFFIFIC